MSKRLLLGVIIVLLITNITTLLFWSNNENMLLDDEAQIRINKTEQVASIGKNGISYEEWMTSLRKSSGKKHLKTMIDRVVVEKLAKQSNIYINDKVIDREIALLATMGGVMTEDEAVEAEKKWQEDISYRYKLEALLTQDMTIPEEEIRTFYDRYYKQYDFTASVQISHIVAKDIVTAEKVITELDNGASFDLLALEYSKDEETKSDGGYLGFYTETSPFIPSGYYETASQMSQYSYSKAFKTDQGIAVIYLHRNLPSITFTYDEVKPHIRGELGLDKSEQTLTVESLWNKLDVKWVYDM